jgi:hypothetical protein
MRRLAVCALTGWLTACSGSAGATGPTGTHATASPTTTATASPALTPCRLPVVQWIQKPQGLEPSAGYLTFPGGAFSADPTGDVVQAGDRYRTAARPYLYGGGPGAGAYDWPLARWVPAAPRSVSPDGSHFAYSQEFGAIHDVDVATGNERVLKGPAGPETILYYAKEGIYFNHAWEGPPGPGLWLMDPNTGKVQTVFSDQPVDAVGGFAAWIADLNPADPHPVFSQYTGGNLPNEILRRDLNGGPTVRWLYQPGKTLNVIGFDHDRHPLIVASGGEPSGANTVWQVPSANQGRVIYTSTDWGGLIADVHGIWFSDNHGVSLYTQSGGLQNASTTRATLAGPCR